MKLPGEAWLEFKIDEENVLTQTATFGAGCAGQAVLVFGTALSRVYLSGHD
jgi:hypothetical protein